MNDVDDLIKAGRTPDEVMELMNPEIKNVLNAFNVVTLINQVNDEVDGPKQLNEALVNLQIDALNAAKMVLSFAKVSLKERSMLITFVAFKMSDTDES